MNRVILHVDQNCYFASVEMINHPEYRNVPMAVVGEQKNRHGIVLAKNQLASDAGVKTAETIWQAKQKCPNLLTVLPHFDKYHYYSERLKELYSEYTDLVESFGLDECWLDISDTLFGREPIEIADEIRKRVKKEFELTCSIGVSFNKIFAKFGSDYKKPDAITVVSESNFKDLVWERPCGELLFVGKRTLKALKKINILTIGDIARSDEKFLSAYLGKHGELLHKYANGKDDSEVKSINYKRDVKSIGKSTTMPVDATDIFVVKNIFHKLSFKVAETLRRSKYLAMAIQIVIRDREMNDSSRRGDFFEATDDGNVIYKKAMEIFGEFTEDTKAIRSLGVRVINLVPAGTKVQLSFLDENNLMNSRNDKKSDVNLLIDNINNKYGRNVVVMASDMTNVFVDKSDNSEVFHNSGNLEDLGFT